MPLRAMFLAHQGWLLSEGTSHLLVDPLLEPEFGAVAHAGLKVFPPRQIDHRDFPPVTAVILTHEHDDHFQIRSLHRLDRRIPIYLSERSSVAAKRILVDMGFNVRPLIAESDFRVGSLQIKTYAPTTVTADEWDVVPFQVTAETGGTFFSSIDIPPPPAALESLRQLDSGLAIAYANNATSVHAFRNWQTPPCVLPQMLGNITSYIDRFRKPTISRPVTLLATGGGWSFSGDLAWLNRCFFLADNSFLESALRALNVDHALRFVAPDPGDCVDITADGVEPGPKQGFVRCVPRVEWPNRQFESQIRRATFLPPLCDSGRMSDRAWTDLHELLARLARQLVGSELYLRLNGFTKEELQGSRRGFVLALESKDEPGRLLEYSPTEAAFRPTDAHLEEYALGASCWAADLLAVLGGAISVPSFTFGRVVEWARCSTGNTKGLSFSSELWSAVHPLRNPEAYYAMYSREYSRLSEGLPVVPAAI